MEASREPITAVKVHRYRSLSEGAEEEDFVVTEEPLAIRVEGREVAVVMRTPGEDEALAVGFLLTEGVLQKKADLFEISTCPSQSEGKGNVVDVLLAGVRVDFQKLSRNVFASSSCGVCGKASIDSVMLNFPPVSSSVLWSRKQIVELQPIFRERQKTFEQTGGLHACGLFNSQGDLLALSEDVGRHNAVDKVLGGALLQDLIPLKDHLLMLSGRISFEIVQKAVAAGISVIAAVSAPSSLAIEFAEASGLTLIGFLRGERMNVYTHAERLLD